MLIISSLAGAADAFARYKPDRVISLLSEDEALPRLTGLPPQRHLKLYVARESCAASISEAARARAKDIIEFAKGWDGAGDILIHCNRGVSRSTAAAFIILCIREPQTPEASLMKRIRAAAPHADPCPLFVTYADEILGRGGRMAEALDDLAPPCAAMPAPVATVKIAA
jgi:predicted protein tyrosine phosphatase